MNIKSDAELKKEIESRFWYHKIMLPNGITTNGMFPIDKDKYQLPADLTGKRVLDVGAWDGYWTFECLKRGAKSVVAIDDFSDTLGCLKPGSRKDWSNFDLCRDIFGYSQKRCKRLEMDVQDTHKLKGLGMFDVVLFFGTFYHLRHPIEVLDTLVKMTRNSIHIESAVCDTVGKNPEEKGYGDIPMMRYYPPWDLYAGNLTNYFVPTLALLKGIVKTAGCNEVTAWKLVDIPNSLASCRGFVTGWKNKDS